MPKNVFHRSQYSRATYYRMLQKRRLMRLNAHVDEEFDDNTDIEGKLKIYILWVKNNAHKLIK